MSRSLARPYALLLASILVVGSVPSAALAQDAQRGKDGDAGPGGDKQARSLFAQGQIHYSLGEYEQAIAAFRRAYELTSAPGLLFNIAQAHRLNGQCRQALEIYRHFIRLAPQSEYLPEAETQIAALVVRCGTPGPDAQAEPARHETPKEAVAPAPIAPVPSVTVQSEPPARWSKRRRAAITLLATGVGLGLAAGGVYWWNQDRYDSWQQEDHRLSAGMGTTPLNVWLADQQRNDALQHSIHRADAVDIGMAGLSLAAVFTSAVLAIVLDR